MENAKSIKNILVKSGYDVAAVCTTGAQTLQSANTLEGGIVICSHHFIDMMYQELYEYLPPQFQMLLVASPAVCSEREIADIVCLSMPLKVHELVQTVEMMEYTIARKRKKMRAQPKQRSEAERNIILEAKSVLMSRNNLTEEEAHRYIQKRSMNNGTDMVETAQMILKPDAGRLNDGTNEDIRQYFYKGTSL